MYIRKNGENWSDSIRISSNCSGNSVDPTILCDSYNNINIVWNDNTDLFNNGGDYDIFYRTYYQEKGWGSIEIVSLNSQSNCKWPFMYINKTDVIYIAWSDPSLIEGSGSDYDIILTFKK